MREFFENTSIIAFFVIKTNASKSVTAESNETTRRLDGDLMQKIYRTALYLVYGTLRVRVKG